jgi:hypothetical protein
MLTPRQLELLRELAGLPEDHDDAALLVVGRRCYFGTTPIHRSTVNALIRVSALKRAYEEGPYWIITSTGRAIARRPELAAEVLAAVFRGGAFSIIDDQIVSIER